MLGGRRPTAVAGFVLAGVALVSGQLSAAAAAPPSGAFSWGANFYGQLGQGHQLSTSTPGPVLPPGFGTLRVVSAGSRHSVGITAAAGVNVTTVGGTVFTWGDNSVGQLGSGQPGGISTTPVQVVKSDGSSLP